MVGGRTVPQGPRALREPSHNARGLVRVSADPPVGTVLPPITSGLPHLLKFFIGPVLGSAHDRVLVISAGRDLVIFRRKLVLISK